MKFRILVIISLMLIFANTSTGQAYAAEIRGTINTYPCVNVSVELFKTKIFGLSKSHMARVVCNPGSQDYRFTGLSKGKYLLQISGPYLQPGALKIELEEGQEFTVTGQPYQSQATVIGLLYSYVVSDPRELPGIAQSLGLISDSYPDLRDCMSETGRRLVAKGLSMNSAEAYDSAVRMWQPGMPTNIPGDIENSVTSTAWDMVKMGNTLFALANQLPGLMAGQSDAYYRGNLFKECAAQADIISMGLRYLRQQAEDTWQMQRQAAALLGMEEPARPPQVFWYQPEVIMVFIRNYNFSLAHAAASTVCD